MIIQFISLKLNFYLNKILKTNNIDYIIASDTDSVYLNLEPLVNSFNEKDNSKILDMLDNFSQENIQPYLEKIFLELQEYTNAYKQKLTMKRESICDKGLWRAKKNYILNSWDDEGVRYSKPKLKMQGIETVRSSTPYICRKGIEEAIDLIMNKDEKSLQDFVVSFKNKFINLDFQDVSSPRGVKGLKKYYDSKDIYKLGTPIHVKGALMFNSLLKEHNIKNIPLIQDGEKIRFAYLKTPNPINCNVIAASDKLPPEFNLENYIDKELQFTKAFLDPITSIISSINWTAEPISNLEGFFE